MGGSEWDYFVPYQPDIEKALQELRQAEFEAGDFYLPDDTPREYTEEERWNWLRYGVPLPGSKGLPKPTTIEKLLELSAEEGTGTILDMHFVAHDKAHGAVAPLRYAQLVAYFGTDKPTRAMVEKSLEKEWLYFDPYTSVQEIHLGMFLQQVTERWREQGTYIIIYKDDQPDEILFIGYSGD